MFGDIGWGEILVLAALALFIFGPDKLPKAAAEAGRALRQLRRMAMNAKRDLESGLGPEMRDFDIADLNPRRFVHKHLFEDDEPSQRTSRPRTRGATVGARDGDGDGRGGDQGGAARPPYDTEAT